MILKDVKLGQDVNIHPSTIFNNVEFGDGVKVAKGCCITGEDDYRVKVGYGSIITMYTIIEASGGDISIGHSASIGQQSVISTRLEIPEGSKLSKLFPVKEAPIIIGEHSWIGSSCIIAPGVSIGCCCIIASNSYVESDVPDFSVFGGNPARLIRKIDPSEVEMPEKHEKK